MDIKTYIFESINTKQKILNNSDIINNILVIADVITECYKNEKKVLFAGNGGSAGDAQHLTTELVSKFFSNRKGLNAISLTTNSSIITAIGNDYEFEKIFSRQIQAIGNTGDVFIAISTSGNSKNILSAIEEAKNKSIKTIGLTGENPCKMDKVCDYIIKVPSTSTPTIQEAHIMIGHIICGLVEEKISCQNTMV